MGFFDQTFPVKDIRGFVKTNFMSKFYASINLVIENWHQFSK